MNLWNIKNEYQNLIDMTNDDSIDPQFIEDTIEALEMSIEEKVDNYSRWIKQLEDEENVLNTRIEDMQNKLTRKKNLVTSLKNKIMFALSIEGKDKMKTEYFDIKVSNNGGVQPMKVIEDMVTPEYIEMKPFVNTKKIRQDLENGKVLPFAMLEERGRHITIK